MRLLFCWPRLDILPFFSLIPPFVELFLLVLVVLSKACLFQSEKE